MNVFLSEFRNYIIENDIIDGGIEPIINYFIQQYNFRVVISFTRGSEDQNYEFVNNENTQELRIVVDESGDYHLQPSNPDNPNEKTRYYLRGGRGGGNFQTDNSLPIPIDVPSEIDMNKIIDVEFVLTYRIPSDLPKIKEYQLNFKNFLTFLFQNKIADTSNKTVKFKTVDGLEYEFFTETLRDVLFMYNYISSTEYIPTEINSQIKTNLTKIESPISEGAGRKTRKTNKTRKTKRKLKRGEYLKKMRKSKKNVKNVKKGRKTRKCSIKALV
jgi:hypothetical protein